MLDYFVSENILGQVSIQLEMTSYDWSRLKASAAWMQVEQILMESEKQNSHCFRPNQTSKSESRERVRTIDALQFNKAVSQHCKESGGDCCKCDLRLYCYLSPSERPDELVSLVIQFLHNHTENHGHYTHHSAASYPCIDDMDMSTAVGGDRYQKPHTLHKQSHVYESCGSDQQ